MVVQSLARGAAHLRFWTRLLLHRCGMNFGADPSAGAAFRLLLSLLLLEGHLGVGAAGVILLNADTTDRTSNKKTRN